MAITIAHLSAGGAPTVDSTDTPSVSLAANKLDIITVFNSHASATPNIPTITGASRTFTQIATKLDATSRWRVTLFRSLSGSANTGVLTIDFAAQTQANVKWSVDEASGIDTGGTNGADAVVQSANNTNSGTQTTLVVTLSAFTSASNAAYGALAKSTTSAVTVGSGFTSLLNDIGLFTDVVEWKLNDVTVDWTWGSESAIATAIALEIKEKSFVPKVMFFT